MRALTRAVFALTLIAPVLPAQLPAIPAWPVASDSRVRVLSPVLGDKKQVGVAVSATRDTLSFRGEKQPSYMSIGTPDIRQLEISQGTHTRRLTGGLIGFVGGAAAGAAIGAATWKKPSCSAGYLFCGFLDTRATNAAIGESSAGYLAGSWEYWLEDERWIPGCRSRYQLDNDGPATKRRR